MNALLYYFGSLLTCKWQKANFDITLHLWILSLRYNKLPSYDQTNTPFIIQIWPQTLPFKSGSMFGMAKIVNVLMQQTQKSSLEKSMRLSILRPMKCWICEKETGDIRSMVTQNGAHSGNVLHYISLTKAWRKRGIQNWVCNIHVVTSFYVFMFVLYNFHFRIFQLYTVYVLVRY